MENKIHGYVQKPASIDTQTPTTGPVVQCRPLWDEIELGQFRAIGGG